MNSVIEIPGNLPDYCQTISQSMGARESDDEKQLKQKLYQKRNKKILAVIVILSAIIFCTVIILRFGVFFKMISPYPTLQNMIHDDKNEDCEYSYRKIAKTCHRENLSTK